MSRQSNGKRWFELVSLFKSFEGSQKDFCIKNNLKLPTFSYWMRKYNERFCKSGSFVEVKRDGIDLLNNFEIHVGPARIKFNESTRLEDVFDFLIRLEAHA